MDGMAGDEYVFLSYSRRDSARVDRLAEALANAGLPVWRDTQSVHGGDRWRTSIVSAIQGADAFLLFVSPNAMESDNVRRELTVAEEEHRRVVPVLLDPTAKIADDFRYSLAGVQYVDVSSVKPDRAVAMILDALQLPVRDPTPPRPAREPCA